MRANKRIAKHTGSQEFRFFNAKGRILCEKSTQKAGFYVRSLHKRATKVHEMQKLEVQRTVASNIASCIFCIPIVFLQTQIHTLIHTLPGRT